MQIMNRYLGDQALQYKVSHLAHWICAWHESNTAIGFGENNDLVGEDGVLDKQ